MKYANIHTGAMALALPRMIINADGSTTHNPNAEQCRMQGWREVASVIDVAAGQTVAQYRIAFDDGKTCTIEAIPVVIVPEAPPDYSAWDKASIEERVTMLGRACQLCK